MRRIKLSEKNVSEVLNKLTPSFSECYDEEFIEKAQVKKSKARNALFGVIINAKFIVLKKDNELDEPTLYSIADIYDDSSSQDLAGLIIYRLNNSGVIKSPTILRMS